MCLLFKNQVVSILGANKCEIVRGIEQARKDSAGYIFVIDGPTVNLELQGQLL